LFLNRVEQYLIQSDGRTLALVASQIAQSVDLLLDERAQDVQTFANASLLRTTGQADRYRVLDQIRNHYPHYALICLTDSNGRITASTDPSIIGADWSRHHTFQRARESKAMVWEDVQAIEGRTGMHGIGWTAPIIDPQDRFLGILTAYIGLPVFENFPTRTINLFRTQHQFLSPFGYQFMSSKGDVLLDSNLQHKGNVNLKRLGLSSAMLSEEGSPGFVEEEDLRRHVPVITGYAMTSSGDNVTRARWTILIRADRSAVLKPIRATVWKLALAGSVICIPLLGLSIWATQRLRKELTQANVERMNAITAEAKYRLLLDSTGEGIYGVDPLGHCTFINKAAATMLGYESATLLGKNLHQLIHHTKADGSSYSSESCPIIRACTEGKPCRVDDDILWRFDGSSFPVIYTAHPIMNDDRVAGAVVTFIDMTDIKQAEDAVRRSERETRAILEHALYAMIKIDGEGLITEWNPEAETIFGWKRDEILGQPLVKTIIPPYLRDAHTRGFRRFLFDGQGPLLNRTIEITALRRDGSEFPVELKASAFQEGNTRVICAFLADISERKASEHKLKESERFMQHAQEVGRLGSWYWNVRADAIIGSQHLYRLFGLKPSAVPITLDRFLSLIHPDDRALVKSAIEGSYTHNRVYDCEFRVVRTDGTLFWCHSRGDVIQDSAGAPEAMVGVLQDIDDRKQVEANLELFKHIIHQIHDPIYWLSPEEGFRFIYVNDAACRHYGYSAETLLGMSVPDWDPNYTLEACEIFWQELKVQKSRTFETLHRRSTGELVPVEVRTNYVAIAGVEYIAGTILDITERKQAESAIKASRDYYHNLFNELPCPVWQTGLDTKCIYFNQAWLNFTGRTLEQELGDGWCEGVHPEDLGQCIHTYTQAFNQRLPFEMEYRLRRYDGEYRWIVDVGRPYRDRDGRFAGYVGSCLDITERTRAERALQESEGHLRRMIDQREQLARDLHDNIIQAIFAVGLSLEDYKRHADTTDGKITLNQAIRVLNQIIKDVRGYIEADGSDSFTPDKLPQLLRRTVLCLIGPCVPQFEIQLTKSALAHLPSDVAKQVLLIAREAMTNSARYSKATQCRVSLEEREGHFYLAISDDGIGFEPSKVSDHGLGLKNIVARVGTLNGQVRILSGPGVGTRILVDFAGRLNCDHKAEQADES
jgi:PAS domain S-box-containing protein